MNAEIAAVVTAYPKLRGAGLASCQPHPGFSGARLLRLTGAEGDFAVKIWPRDSAHAGRLHWVHRLMTRAGERLFFVPRVLTQADGATVFVLHGRHVEVVTWQPGRADFHELPTPGKLENACRALALLHESWANGEPGFGPCPAIARRLTSLSAWRRHEAALLTQRLPAPLDAALDAVRRWSAPAVEALLAWNMPLPLQPCLCDVWHDHVLFTGDDVTGLVDYGSVKRDHVAVDLARLLGSLIEDDGAARQRGLSAYGALRPLAAVEVQLIHLLDRTGLIVALSHWLRWLGLGERKIAQAAQAAMRVASLAARVGRWRRLIED